MDWDEIVELIPAVIENIRADYILNNMIIRDDIFGILEKYCTVIYYPMKDEENWGFHTRRFVNGKLEDFVYINTAKTIAEQVFTAAHELGHVWRVAKQIWEQAGEQGCLERKTEERIINRFAAELLMPTEEFRKTFKAHMEKLSFDPDKLRLAELARVLALQMNDYMVPYESVRRRMIETNILSVEDGDFLLQYEDIILSLANIFSQEQNTMLDKVTEKKTIPGLRDLIGKAEKNGAVSPYTICRIKKDFNIADISEMDDIREIAIDGGNDGED